jgi:hypothetical protein
MVPNSAASDQCQSHCLKPTFGGSLIPLVCLLVAVHEALREVAFRERLKIHDIILEGIEMALRNRGKRK